MSLPGSGYRRIDEDEDDTNINNNNNGQQSGGMFHLPSFSFTDDNNSTDVINNTNNDDEDDDEDCLTRFCPSLTWQERLGGCVACMLLGYILSLGSFFRMKDVFLFGTNYKSFVMYSTVGNIISLSGSFFLSGPKAQFQKMWHEKRKVATTLYLSSLAVTLLVCIMIPSRRSSSSGTNNNGDDYSDSDSDAPRHHRHSFALKVEGMMLLLLLGCQYVSVAWYCLSYIPFARQIARNVMRNVVSRGGSGGVSGGMGYGFTELD